MNNNSLKIGFIGAGNMATSILKGIIDNGLIDSSSIYMFDIDDNKLNYLVREYGVQSAKNACDIVDKANTIILAVKPNVYPLVLNEIKDSLNDSKILVSIAAGISVAYINSYLSQVCKIVRIMPNTPALIGCGMTVLCRNDNLEKKERETIVSILSSIGEVVELDEKYIDAVIGVSGSGPAYVYMFIEAMADGGVLSGLPRDIAYKLAAQTVSGAAQMVLKTDKHPGELKDMVTSPGGTTIEAVKILEKGALRANVISAVQTAANKSKSMRESNEK